MVKSKKYQGVYHRKKKDGDITYYFTYQNDQKKTQYQKVGDMRLLRVLYLYSV